MADADIKTLSGKILYASYQESETLPGYVRYALAGLSQTGFPVVYLTNERDLDADSHAFLDSHHIELFFTVNSGYDFGMWRRYLEYVAKFRKESWGRLVLINDSIVYYQNRFHSIFSRAEASDADAVSLTQNEEFRHHLQSFFLYLKPRAIQTLLEHFERNPETDDFYDTVRVMEVGFSGLMQDKGLKLEALYSTSAPVLFSYLELIRAKAGFVKRKLLEKRFTNEEVFHFWKNGADAAYKTDYAKFIAKEGALDKDFRQDWLVTDKKSVLHGVMYFFRMLYLHFRWNIHIIKQKVLPSSL